MMNLSCATNMPTGYNQIVRIKTGPYKDLTGVLIGDCSGIENYQVKIYSARALVCVRSWNMERIF